MAYQLFTDRVEDWSAKYHGDKFHAVLCDPPYGLKFMGKDWDVVSAKEWGEALLPHLYPGALVFMFGGTRTWHKLATGMEDAGFEIWDTLMWLHGQGFPKGQDISKLIDKTNGRIGHSTGELKLRLKALFKDKGFTQASLDAACGFSAWSYASERYPWDHVLPSGDKWLKLKSVLGCGDADSDLDSLFAEAMREVIGKSPWSNSINHFVPGEDHTQRVTLDVTAPGSTISAHWSGHKTCALKPAWEPILAFRVPTKSGYADLALTHGSGALNIDASRIPLVSGADDSQIRTMNRSAKSEENGWGMNQNAADTPQVVKPEGRYPANLLLDEESASLLDEQAGVRKSGTIAAGQRQGDWKTGDTTHERSTGRPPHAVTILGSEGGASRFFYCAKASTSERNAGLGDQKNTHPTVKPIALIKYLAGLLLPPSSVPSRRLLVPFAGSGSEMIGALNAGWDEVIGIEQNPEYSRIAEARLAHATAA